MTIGTAEVVTALTDLLVARLVPVLAARGLEAPQTWLTVPDFALLPSDLPLVSVHGGALTLTRDDSLLLDASLSLTVTVIFGGDGEEHAATLAWAWQKALVEVLLHYPLDVADSRCYLTVTGVDPAGSLDPVEDVIYGGWDARLTVHVPDAYDPSVDPLTGPSALPTAEDLIVTTPLLDVEV